ncbi:MAG: hypothetical protein A3D92_24275 [Bacteroidetes bacterium RIFCSPHIGHO2_02_FULL_44_7]|nr:MAG: hypothetical protein A3D92_24275 [Bacteroidetes bacterium RIFCSPHIGHO2_02_FULL_44_7]
MLSACKEDKVDDPVEPVQPLLRITVQPTYGSETLYLDSTYITPEGYEVQFTELRFYMGEPANNGISFMDAALFDYRERGNLLAEVVGKHEDFPALQGFLGIASSSNHADPAAFPNASMLNIANANDMHWGWSNGYIFMKVEAKVDTIQDGIPLFDHNVVFHIGGDENLKSLNFPNVTWSDLGGVHAFALRLDMLNFLGNGSTSIDLKTEFTSHSAPGQEALSDKVISNFTASLSPL